MRDVVLRKRIQVKISKLIQKFDILQANKFKFSTDDLHKFKSLVNRFDYFYLLYKRWDLGQEVYFSEINFEKLLGDGLTLYDRNVSELNIQLDGVYISSLIVDFDYWFDEYEQKIR